MAEAKKGKKAFKYWKKCKLPSCRREFGTNRKWQEFCCPEHQREWQKLLRRKHEEVIVEVMTLKEDMTKVKNKLGMK